MLIVTNGSSGVAAIREVLQSQTEILAWEDVLHDGPVPSSQTLHETSQVRIAFLSSWVPTMADSSGEEIRRRFKERDRRIGECDHDEEVVLWFDHDLYDQLQLLQTGWYLSRSLSGRALPRVAMVDSDYHLLPTQRAKMVADFEARMELSRADLRLLASAWDSFTKSEPDDLVSALAIDWAPFAHLGPALYRLWQEYPSVETGLNRSELQILEVLRREQVVNPVRLFRLCSGLEEAAYLGDWSFWRYVERLSGAVVPLVQRRAGLPFRASLLDNPDEFRNEELLLSTAGTKVMDGELVWDRAGADYWLGGVAISEESPWRRGGETRTIFMA